MLAKISYKKEGKEFLRIMVLVALKLGRELADGLLE